MAFEPTTFRTLFIYLFVYLYLFIYLFTITATPRIEDYQPVWSAKNNDK